VSSFDGPRHNRIGIAPRLHPRERVRAPAPARFLLPLIYLGYISLGLPDGAFGVAWPKVYPELNLPLGLAGTVLTMGTLFAATSGFSSGWLMARWQTGSVVLGSGLLTASGLLILAHARGAAWLYAAAVPLGFGAGAVDACLNGFVARHYSGRHMNWLHACWGIGASSGPLFLGYAMGTAQGWRGGYLMLGLMQLTLAGLFACTLGWWQRVPERKPTDRQAATGGKIPTTPANSPAGWLSALIFALYVAVEMTTGLWAGTVLVASRGFTPGMAAVCTACFYAAITGGRILVGFIVDRHGNRRLVGWGVSIALLGMVWFALGATTPLTAGLALILAGAGFAPVYPCLMHEVPQRFAPEATQTVIGRQSGAASLGAAALPALAGWAAQHSLAAVPALIAFFIFLLAASIRKLNRMT
jgi:MFS family permease